MALLASISRPDRGGVSRCEKLTLLNKLNIFLGPEKPILPWKPFEEPKFKFHMIYGKDIMPYLLSEGYSNWKVGGISFGSIDIGWESHEDNIYASKNISGGKRVYISLSKTRNEIVFVLR